MHRYLIACLVFLLGTLPLRAHEVRPAIGDLTTGGGTLTLVLRMSVEPVLAGVDLEGLADTNDAESAEAVDAFRSLSVPDLHAEIEREKARILEPIVATTPAGPVPMTMQGVETDPEPNFDLPRETRLTLTGPLPPGAATVTVTWPASYGVLVLRQIDSDEGYTGYLIGGSSEPMPVARGDGPVRSALSGAQHVISHPAHVLLALSLVLLTLQTGPLLAQWGAFVAGHLGALGLLAFGVAAPAASAVELLTAALVVYVAGEAFFSDRLRPGRLSVLAVFAALHGLKLASGRDLVGAAAFNLGVDAAQAGLLGIAAVLLLFMRRAVSGAEAGQAYRTRVVRPLSAGFALAGAGLLAFGLMT